MIDINLHEFRSQLKVRFEGNTKFIWDPLRKKYLVPQPEELVRQLLILYLTQKLDYPISRIQVEKSLKVFGQNKRYDIIVYDQDIKPYLLIECKSHKEPINQSVLDQASRYNITLNAPYLLVTNGVQTYCCAIDKGNKKAKFLREVPNYND